MTVADLWRFDPTSSRSGHGTLTNSRGLTEHSGLDLLAACLWGNAKPLSHTMSHDIHSLILYK